MSAHRRDYGSGSRDADVELSQYTEVFRRRWWIMLLCVLLGTGLAVAMLMVMPKTYRSTASVLVAANGSSNGSVENGRTSSTLNLDTEAQIVTSSSVASLAADALPGSETPRELAKKTSATVPANTSVLEISFKDSSPRGAQRGAEAFAEAYLKNREQLAQDRIDQQMEQAQKRIDSLSDQLEKVGVLIQAQPVGSAARDFQAARRDLLVRQIGAVNDQLVTIQASDAAPGDIITEPQVPTKPIAPSSIILLASGVMAGFLLGLVLAFIVDRRDRRVRDRRELDRLGLEPLVPYLIVPPAGEIAAVGNTHYDAEPMRVLRNSLLAQMPDHRGSIMVAAASGGTEGSAVALNLAATFARSGLDVIFASAEIDATDAGDPSSRRVGLVDVLQDRIALDEVLHPVEGEPGLRTLSPGMDGSLYSELVQSERLQHVLASLVAKADILVFDVAPMSETADAQSLASEFDGVVVVAAAKRTTVDDVAEAVDQLRHVSARIFGAVLAIQGTRPGGVRTDTHLTPD